MIVSETGQWQSLALGPRPPLTVKLQHGLPKTAHTTHNTQHALSLHGCHRSPSLPLSYCRLVWGLSILISKLITGLFLQVINLIL